MPWLLPRLYAASLSTGERSDEVVTEHSAAVTRHAACVGCRQLQHSLLDLARHMAMHMVRSRTSTPAWSIGDWQAEEGLARLCNDLTQSTDHAFLEREGCACRLGRAFHLRLLSALCNDLIEGVALKAEIQTRVDNMLALHASHRQSQIEVSTLLNTSSIPTA